ALGFEAAGAFVGSYHGGVHQFAVEYSVVAELEGGAGGDQNVALTAAAKTGAQLLELRGDDAEDRAARPGTLEALLGAQGSHAEDDGVGVGAQQVHQPAVFGQAADIGAAGLVAQKRDYAVEGLHEVGVDPGAGGRRGRKDKPAVARHR